MEGSYMLAVNGGDTPIIVYDTNNGWAGEDTVTIPEYTISVVNEIAGWNGIIVGNATEISSDNNGDDSAFTSLAVGQSIEKIVFNPNVSIEKMTNYLASLPYDLELNGENSVTKLVNIGTNLAVWALNFNAFADTMGTSGYGIAVIDKNSGTEVLVQSVFASEYNTANGALVDAIKDDNYIYEYTQAGWVDTNDYVLPETHTITYVYDDKVGEFIGVVDKFWE